MSLTPRQTGELDERARHSAVAGKILRPLSRYIYNEATEGTVLLVAAVVALVLANGPWSEAYFGFLEREIAVETPWLTIRETIHHWINDGLMAGLGFTVSLFITNLAFSDSEMILNAKIAIFAAYRPFSNRNA